MKAGTMTNHIITDYASQTCDKEQKKRRNRPGRKTTTKLELAENVEDADEGNRLRHGRRHPAAVRRRRVSLVDLAHQPVENLVEVVVIARDANNSRECSDCGKTHMCPATAPSPPAKKSVADSIKKLKQPSDYHL